MKIIKQGKIPNQIKRFACKHCGTVFEAEKGEYESTCPVCGHTVTIDRRSK